MGSIKCKCGSSISDVVADDIVLEVFTQKGMNTRKVGDWWQCMECKRIMTFEGTKVKDIYKLDKTLWNKKK